MNFLKLKLILQINILIQIYLIIRKIELLEKKI